LFGHKKGAFTGATHDKKGLFEEAHGGTIFLDEIGELSLPLQVKLLRAVQQRSFKPVGDTKDVDVDIRIISATNKRLEEEVIEGRFREDLFYRLNVIEIKVPSLRERKSDIKHLAQFFLDKFSRDMGKDISKISSYAVELLQKYDFPGNVRELENLIERSVALSSTNIILPESLSLASYKRRWIEGVPNRRFDLQEVEHGVQLDDIMDSIEKAYVQKAIEFSNGKKAKAAKLLDITFRSMRYRCEKHGIE
jgi:two-component system response regulator PilR (NtrC family)